ncbi:hypothetical protein BFC17_22040 [Alteromonas lipolytica]|uniref:Uncharacterized protein n=1 Tax=Alteromonas lipolytica TaxID=1856405 RepID=A0A1E8FE78_9ALTE|nr:hypothetical protein BFC17_22040 [Alteromonas lipolytica]
MRIVRETTKERLYGLSQVESGLCMKHSWQEAITGKRKSPGWRRTTPGMETTLQDVKVTGNKGKGNA